MCSTLWVHHGKNNNNNKIQQQRKVRLKFLGQNGLNESDQFLTIYGRRRPKTGIHSLNI